MPALRSPLFWQVSVALLLLAAFTLMPPARGALLLVPIRGDAGTAVRVGVAAGASLVRIGPWPGSVIMWGDRAALAGPLRAAGVLMLAAPLGGCADGERERLS